MNSDEKTLPDLLTILEAINRLDQKIDAKFDNLRQEMLQKINELRQEISHKIDVKVDELEAKVAVKFEEMRLQMMSIEAQTDYLRSSVHETLSVGHKSLSIAYDVRGDVRVLREEVYSLMNEVRLRKLEPAAVV